MSGEKRSISLYDDESPLAPLICEKNITEPAEKKMKIDNKDPSNVVERKNAIETVPSLSFAPPLLHGLGTRIGEREEMQDAHLAVDCLLPEHTDMKRCALFCIFDGHGGARAAHHCEKHFPILLQKKLNACPDVPTMEKSLKRIFTDTYKQIDESFLAEAKKHKPVWKDGTTMTTVLILNNSIYSGNIGDSRAVVARRKIEDEKVVLVPMQLTVDHSPQHYEERMRIQKAGGMVKDGRIMGILEVSRSIGDGQFKAQGVTSVPDMKKLTVTKDDRFLILACDGLWKCFSNEEAIQFVEQSFKKAKEEDLSTGDVKRSENSLWTMVADQMAAEAVRRKCGDNVSVMIVELSVCQ